MVKLGLDLVSIRISWYVWAENTCFAHHKQLENCPYVSLRSSGVKPTNVEMQSGIAVSGQEVFLSVSPMTQMIHLVRVLTFYQRNALASVSGPVVFCLSPSSCSPFKMSELGSNKFGGKDNITLAHLAN